MPFPLLEQAWFPYPIAQAIFYLFPSCPSLEHTLLLIFFNSYFIIFIGVELIFNAVLVSGIEQSGSIIYISTLF